MGEQEEQELSLRQQGLVSGNAFTEIGVVGINFKTAPIAVREEFARSITVEKLAQLKSAREELSSAEIVLLSTCNRIEIYYYQSPPSSTLSKSFEELFQTKSSQRASFQIYHHVGIPAVNHLFEVATGLDSLVIGEAQILLQVREANKMSADQGLAGPIISKLFFKAYEVGRRAREDAPELSSGLNNSVSSAVLGLISQEYAEEKPNLLLVGSGKMIKLAIGHIEKSRLGSIVVASRRPTLDGIKAADSVAQLSQIGQVIVEKKIDVIITATSADDYVLKQDDLKGFLSLERSPSRKLVIIDISVPRNVDPRIADYPGVTLLNLDDLKDHIGSNEDTVDSDLAQKIKKSISLGASEFVAWMIEQNEIAPIMSVLRKKVEVIRSEEIENALSRMPDLTPEEKVVIERMTERLARRFLHGPTARLKGLTRRGEAGKAKQYTEAIWELFSPDSAEWEADEQDNEQLSTVADNEQPQSEI